MKRLFLLVLVLLQIGAGPVIWNGTRSKALTEKGLTLSDGTTLDNDGRFNAVKNYGFEDPTIVSGWSTYDDGAVDTPVNCTGGSATAISSISRTTTTAEVDTGVGAGKLAKSAADGQGEGWAYTFQLPTHLRNGTVNLNWDQIITDADYTAGDIRVYVYDVDNSTLITPQFITMGGGTTPDLAAGNGAVRMSFLASSADDYRLCIHVATTDAAAYDVFIDNVFIGDSGITVGSGVGPVTTWPIQALKATTTSPTLSNNNAKYWRIGQWLNYDVQFSFTNANKGSGDYYLDLPTGLTVDTSVILSTDYPALGSGDITITSSGRSGLLQYDQASGRLKLSFADGSALLQFLDSTDISSGTMYIRLQGRIPIAEWAGGQTLGENNVEYACSSTGTWDAAAAAANTIYGPAGCPMSGALSASRAKVVQWQTPIDASDDIQLELTDQSDGTGWVTPAEFGTISIRQGSSFYGASSLKTSSTQSTATFQQYAQPSNATYAGTGSAWSSAWRWRMVKRKSGVVVPFGLATSSQPGLANPYTAGSGVIYHIDYTPTFTSGTNGFGTPTPNKFHCERVGPSVYCSGNIFNFSLSASALTQFDISLPISTTSLNDDTVQGGGSYGNVSPTATAVLCADDAGNETEIRCYFTSAATTTSNNFLSIWFKYQIN